MPTPKRNRADERRILSIAGSLHDLVSGRAFGALTVDELRDAVAKASILAALVLSRDTEIVVTD
jgi:hypothetical protein